MFTALLKTRISSIFSGMLVRRKNKKNTPLAKVGVAILLVYIIAVFAFMFGGLFSQLAVPFHEGGIDWFYFAIAILLSSVMMLVGSVFTAYAQLYNARDNDLLLSMPIPSHIILASRMASLYIINFVLGAAVLVPAGAVWGAICGMNVTTGVLYVLTTLLLPFFALSLSCILGALIAVISSRIRAKSAVTTIISLAFLAVYFLFISRMNNYVAALIANGEALADKISAALPLLWMAQGIADGNIVYFLLSILCVAALFAAVYALLSAFFIKIVTRNTGFAKRRYVAGKAKASSVQNALFRRELARFTSSPTYMMNGALGAVFVVAMPIVLIIRRDILNMLVTSFGFTADMTAAAASAAICFLCTTVMISAASVSLEGRNIQLIQSMPVQTSEIMRAKLKLHLAIALPPTVIAQIVLLVMLRPGIMGALALIITPLVFVYFGDVNGLALNLKFPKLDWINEASAVKQSMSTFIAMMGPMAICGLLILPYMALASFISAPLCMLMCAALFAVISALLRRYIMTRGCTIFAHL